MDVSHFQLVGVTGPNTGVGENQRTKTYTGSSSRLAFVRLSLAVLIRLHSARQSKRYFHRSKAGRTRFFFGVKVTVMEGCCLIALVQGRFTMTYGKVQRSSGPLTPARLRSRKSFLTKCALIV